MATLDVELITFMHHNNCTSHVLPIATQFGRVQAASSDQSGSKKLKGAVERQRITFFLVSLSFLFIRKLTVQENKRPLQKHKNSVSWQGSM